MSYMVTVNKNTWCKADLSKSLIETKVTTCETGRLIVKLSLIEPKVTTRETDQLIEPKTGIVSHEKSLEIGCICSTNDARL